MDRFERIAARIAADEENSLDGMKNPKARREVNKVLHRNAPRGILHDQDWRWVNQVWKALDSAVFDWNLTDSFYTKNRDGMPESKTWKFEIHFENDKGRKTTIYGVLTASGAGSVSDPLEKYDIVVYAS
jgi:hypothetical protein